MADDTTILALRVGHLGSFLPSDVPKEYELRRWDLGWGVPRWVIVAGSADYYTDSTEAIAACHRHRNRIAAEALRDLVREVLDENPDATSVWLDALTKRADTLDPKETT